MESVVCCNKRRDWATFSNCPFNFGIHSQHSCEDNRARNCSVPISGSLSSTVVNFQSEQYCSDSAQPGHLGCQLRQFASGAYQRGTMSIISLFPDAADSQ